MDALAPTENIVAFCDVDSDRAADFREKYPKARNFVDYRKMLDAMDKSIDAVIVATPNHTHAVLANAAIKSGKHVYCEKPLAHAIGEVRAMMKAAEEHKVVTQMGNQGHSFDATRMFCEWIWDSAIGDVHTIHARCCTSNGAEPPGRPQAAARRPGEPQLGPLARSGAGAAVPSGLSSREMAGLDALRRRHGRRLGLPCH